MHFIELTYIDGSYILINMQLVQELDRDGLTTRVHFSKNDYITVQVTPKQILEMC